ncbi:MAG: hypothetical protein JWP94_1490 [Mucilaginibacter sp.]|jgi:phosphoglycolate phosphatase-like HAD superfamily hydrolase|nr:hypothetical protein [Mucilaginibacter sp.]
MTVFFDFDGTLIDVKLKYFNIYIDFVRKYNGIALDVNRFWTLKRSMTTNDVICINSGISALFGEQLKEFTRQNIENLNYLAYDSLFDDAVEVLTYLRKKNTTVNVISMRRNHVNLRNQVANIGLSNYIDQVYAPHELLGKNIIEGDPLSKSHAIRSLGAYNNKAILIGDTGTDVKSARHLGWQSVGVLTGLRNRDEIERYQPDFIIERLNDFISIYEKYEHTFC